MILRALTLVMSLTIEVFRTLYHARFPIRRMEPVDAFGGRDTRSMAADNTSSFNCRHAVANGPPTWSMHAYGEAIDVNTVENPWSTRSPRSAGAGAGTGPAPTTSTSRSTGISATPGKAVALTASRSA